MPRTCYCAAPAGRCRAPARTFARRREAVQYARVAAELLGVSYAVWRVRPWRLRLLRWFPPTSPCA